MKFPGLLGFLCLLVSALNSFGEEFGAGWKSRRMIYRITSETIDVFLNFERPEKAPEILPLDIPEIPDQGQDVKKIWLIPATGLFAENGQTIFPHRAGCESTFTD